MAQEIIPFYDFDVVEPNYDDVDFYVPDYIEVIDRNPDQLFREEAKRIKYEMKLSDANNAIEHLAPKLKELQARIDEIENGNYDDSNLKISKELERLKDKEYSVSKKLSKAECDKVIAEKYFERYGE